MRYTTVTEIFKGFRCSLSSLLLHASSAARRSCSSALVEEPPLLQVKRYRLPAANALNDSQLNEISLRTPSKGSLLFDYVENAASIAMRYSCLDAMAPLGGCSEDSLQANVAVRAPREQIWR